MTEISKPRQILPTIECGDTECGECGNRQIGQFDNLECQYGNLSAPWSIDVDQLKSGKWMTTKRLPQCLEDEQKANGEVEFLELVFDQCEFNTGEDAGDLYKWLDSRLTELRGNHETNTRTNPNS
jgi:hypothetical protein